MLNRADARLLVDVLALPRRRAHLFDDLAHEVGHHDGELAAQIDVRLLLHDLDAKLPLERIVRVDHGADAVLELRDDLAAAVVRGRVGREEDQDVDVETDRVSADLHVALFENIEQAHLHQFVQLRQFVDGEDAAVHPRNEPEVQGLFGRHARAGGQFRGIDLADDVGELRARGQPLGIALLARPPGDGHLGVGHFDQQSLGHRGDRMAGILVHGAAGDVEIRDPFVQEAGQQPHQPALALALLAQEEHVVLGDQSQVDFRYDGVFVADDAGEELFAPGEHPHEVVVHLPFYGLGMPAARSQLAEGRRWFVRLRRFAFNSRHEICLFGSVFVLPAIRASSMSYCTGKGTGAKKKISEPANPGQIAED